MEKQFFYHQLLLCMENCLLLTGDGSEFSSVDHFNYSIAQSEISFSNYMIEAINKILKYYYLYKFNITSFEQLARVVEFAIQDYNNRPHQSLKGASPNEAFPNTIILPDKEILSGLRLQRIIENKNKCCRA